MFFFFIFFCNLLIPIVMVLGGYWMSDPPKKIGSLVGYRSRMSKKNPDTWKFAHVCCGRIWKKIGWIMMVPSILVQLPFIHGSETVIGNAALLIELVQLLVLLGSIIYVERALRSTFDENGKRRAK